MDQEKLQLPKPFVEFSTLQQATVTVCETSVNNCRLIVKPPDSEAAREA